MTVESTYLTGGDSLQEILGDHYGGQTFMVSEPMHLFFVALQLSKYLLLADVECRIYHADTNHEPTGAFIALGRLSQWEWTDPFGVKRWLINMTNPILLPLHLYFLEVRYRFGIIPPFFSWQYDQGDATYPYGHRSFSIDGGATWTHHYNDDFLFSVYGNPPSPPSPVIPPSQNWIITDQWYYTTLDGMTIVIATNIPCHLFMYWTLEPPLKHITPRLRRGLPFSDMVDYCFVAWEANEQLEPGDTLYHTFFKPNWPICQTRWFVFQGTIEGQISKSISPIFTKHQKELLPEPILAVFNAHTNNRTIRSNHVNYNTCWNGASLQVLPEHEPPGNRLYSSAVLTASHWLLRSFLTFDTSPIPDHSLIVSAFLSLWDEMDWHTASAAKPYWQATPGHQSDPVVTADWATQNSETTVLGQISYFDLITNQYNRIDLNALGLGYINQTGLTKYSLRAELDVLKVSTPLGANACMYKSTQAGPGLRPTLSVRYIPPQT